MEGADRAVGDGRVWGGGPPHIANNRSAVDATLVREFIRSLEDRPSDDQTAARVRTCLETIGHPDVRFLVGLLRGQGAGLVERYARGVLAAAGATTAGEDDVLDDPLIERSGTMAASAAYQLAAMRPDLGELSRSEGALLLVLTAAAEASCRVVLLRDEAVDANAPQLAVTADLVALLGLAPPSLAEALALVPDRRPVVVAPEGAVVPTLDAQRELTLVVAGLEFQFEARAGQFDLAIGDERYASLALGSGDDPLLAATGIVVALGLGAQGVRMRPEWVEQGARAAATMA